MKVRVMKIGPLRALIYSKELSPRRFALVPVGVLPQEAREGEVVEITLGGILAMPQPPAVISPKATVAGQTIRRSY